MGQDARAQIGFGVNVERLPFNFSLRDVEKVLAERMGLESASPYRDRSPEEEELFEDFKERWGSIGIATIDGGNYDYPDSVLVAEETVYSTWWEDPEALGQDLADPPSPEDFKDRLDRFLDLAREIHGEIEIDGEPQWYMVAFFG